MKKQTMIRRWAALMVCVCLLCGLLTSCSGNATNEEKAPYAVIVRSEGGLPLADVRVTVYKDSAHTQMVWAALTGKDGMVTFQATPAAGMKVVLSELPDGYEAETSYRIESEQTTVKLKAHLVDATDLSTLRLSLGDMMCDFSVMAGDPSPTASSPMTEYTLSELLKTKKAVVLNFWFEGCGPCRAEFPYLQKAYEQYGEDVAVLAINPYDGDAQSVLTYAANLGLTFPVVKGDAAWASCMQITAYPTTVVIDRYGSIAMIHKGSITQEGVFETVFDHFIADDYVQSTVRNIGDLA